MTTHPNPGNQAKLSDSDKEYICGCSGKKCPRSERIQKIINAAVREALIEASKIVLKNGCLESVRIKCVCTCIKSAEEILKLKDEYK